MLVKMCRCHLFMECKPTRLMSNVVYKHVFIFYTANCCGKRGSKKKKRRNNQMVRIQPQKRLMYNWYFGVLLRIKSQLIERTFHKMCNRGIVPKRNNSVEVFLQWNYYSQIYRSRTHAAYIYGIV